MQTRTGLIQPASEDQHATLEMQHQVGVCERCRANKTQSWLDLGTSKSMITDPQGLPGTADAGIP